MSDTAALWTSMLSRLPAIADAEEQILRGAVGGSAEPSVTVRRRGAPPRVFAADGGGGVRELLPQHDEGLVGRTLLADRAALDAALAPLLGELADAELVAWRPGRRAVVRVRTRAGSLHWLKLLDRKSHRRATAAFAALGSPLSPMRLARPTHALPELRAFVAADAGGRPLRELLAAGDAPPLAGTVRALLALGYTEVHGDLPQLWFEDVLRQATGMLAKAAAVRPELLELVPALTAMPAPRRSAAHFVHGDLHDKQLFFDDDGATLIDLEGASLGDPRFDLANLVEHVRLRDLQQHGEDRALADLLLLRCGFAVDDAEMLAFRVAVRARLCGVYALRPRWQALVERLVGEVTGMMEELR